jgi:hypothetical protein
VIQERANVMHKERIQRFRDLLLVGKIQRTVEWNPNTLEMHWANLDNVSHLFALENSIPTSTSHSRNVEKLGAIDHMVIYSEKIST